MNWEECKKMLNLLHYKEQEMEEQRQRIETALDRAEVTDEQIILAQNNIQAFDLEAPRKVLGIWFKRYVDLMLCRDEKKKIVYHVHPGIPRLNLAFANAYPDVFSDFPDTAMMFIFGTLFNRMEEILECAEKNGMEQPQAQCAINQVTYGAVIGNYIPKPDLLVAGRFQCDQTVKTCELISEMVDVPFVAFDTVRDEPWGFFPEVADRAVVYFGDEYEEALEKSCKILGVEPLSEEVWKKARKDYVLPWILMNDAHQIYIDADPRPARLKNQQVFLFSILEPPGNYLNEFLDAVQLYVKELRKRVKEGYGVLPKGAPRVAMMCGTSFTLHDDSDMYEEAGINVVIPAAGIWLAPWERGEKRAETPYQKIAWSYIQKGYVRVTYDHTYRFKKMAETANLDGILFAVQFSCRVLALPFYMVKKECEEAGIPAMYLEIDGVDPRTHTADTLRTRVEAFGELLRARKKA